MPSRDRRALAGYADISAPHIAMADDLRQHELRGVAGDCKTDALRAADDRGVDPDHFGGGRHQRTAGITGIERRIGLDHVFDGPAVRRTDRAAERRDYAGRDGRFKSERVADRDYQLAAAQAF